MPDYRYDISLVIDSFIDGDETAEHYNFVANEVKSRLNKWLLQEEPLSSLFGELPIVGFYGFESSFTISEGSNRMTAKMKAVASF